MSTNCAWWVNKSLRNVPFITYPDNRQALHFSFLLMCMYFKPIYAARRSVVLIVSNAFVAIFSSVAF